ncbi:MAG: cytochrome c oxidase assembly protein [Ktedonobacteraceae bacterium]
MNNAILGPDFWLTAWNWQPSIILGTIAIIGLYLYAVGPLRVKYHLADAVKTSQVVSFLLGVNVIFWTLFTPLDRLADDYLFSAHMVLHLLLSFAGAPLMVLGIPGWLVAPLLRNRTVLKIGQFFTMPILTGVLFNANLWFWHAPPIYNAMIVNLPLHITSHLLFITTGVLFWWPILSPMEEGLPPLSIGRKMAYLFFSDMPMVLLGAGLTFVPPLYVRYIHVPRLWGLSPETDQQLAGLLMWIPGSIFFIVIVSILFLQWMQDQDAKQRTDEATLYDDNDEEIEIERVKTM